MIDSEECVLSFCLFLFVRLFLIFTAGSRPLCSLFKAQTEISSSSAEDESDLPTIDSCKRKERLIFCTHLPL